MMKTLLPLLFTTLFITKSSGLSILFSSTYFAIRSIKGLPYRIAFPLLTPWHFSRSVRVMDKGLPYPAVRTRERVQKAGGFFSLPLFDEALSAFRAAYHLLLLPQRIPHLRHHLHWPHRRYYSKRS